MPAKVISFINLKGGVGKTTLALACAEILAGTPTWKKIFDPRFFDYVYREGPPSKVLLIDLDGQANLTFAVLGEDTIRECWDNHRSTYHFFASILEGRRKTLEECVRKTCSNVESAQGNLHFIPSSIELFNFEEKIIEACEKGMRIDLFSLRKELKKALIEEGLLEAYDYVIIDCPPNLSVLTENAIIASDFYVVPVIPEKLSTYGLELIKRRVGELREEYQEYTAIEFLGTVLNRVDVRRADHLKLAEKIITDNNFKTFDNWIGDVKPLYIVTDFGYGPYPNPYCKYGGGMRRKNPVRSEILFSKGSGTTPYFINIYYRISGFVEELRHRAS